MTGAKHSAPYYVIWSSFLNILGSNIIFGNLLPNTLGLRPLLNLRDQVARTYKNNKLTTL